MANVIKPKRSNTAAKVPNTSELLSGELGVNMADKKIYINNGTSVVQVGAGVLSALGDVVLTTPSSGQSLSYNGTNWVNSSAGAGDVVGAASSTDNAITRFDGTTGKIIQNSNVTLDDTGNIVGANSVQFGLTPTVPTATGAMYWDSGNLTPTVNLNANTSLQLGQENVALVYNGTGSTIAAGSVVAVSGAQGQRPSVVLADADSEALSAPTLGIATEAIANGAEGFVTTFGFVRGINTSAFTAGAPIYLSQTAGQFTATRPSAPAHTVALGWVIKVNASSGEVFVNINNGWELDELHNVLITSAASGNTLIYDAVAGVWENANLTDGTGITITEGAGTITVANSGVLGVTATSPVASSGGQNPVISMPAATTSVSGYLTSTDWNTFNNKTSNTGTVTSVSATVPTGLSIAGSPITTSGTLAITYTAGYSIPTTASQTNWDTAYSVRQQWNGGSTNLVAATGRTSLGATTVGGNFFTLTNPSAITFPRMNADNTVSALDAATFRTAIGAGTSSTTGTVTSVAALTLGTTGTDLSSTVATGTTTPVITLQVPTASATNRGALSSADWTTFNNKQAALGFTPYNATNPSNYIALASAITGYTVGTNTALAATDTLLAGLGKIQGQINARGTGNGTVTSVATGTGLSGGTITTTGTISLANTAVTAGSYTNTNITVDAQGRITAAANGSAGGVTSVTGTAPVVSSGGATPAISMAAATTSANGYLTSTDWNTFNGKWTNGTALTATTGTFSGAVTASAGIYLNGLTIAASYTIPASTGAHSVGAITLNSGVTVTVSSGSRWVIL